MKYLLDTHIILWTLLGDENIYRKISDIINNSNNDIYYSTASTWEIEIKHQSRNDFKLSGQQFAFLCDQNGLVNLQIRNMDIVALEKIIKKNDIKHNDLFDRLLLAQAICENMTFITHDKKFSAYANSNILLI